jgi:hypothetical protein
MTDELPTSHRLNVPKEKGGRELRWKPFRYLPAGTSRSGDSNNEAENKETNDEIILPSPPNCRGDRLAICQQ